MTWEILMGLIAIVGALISLMNVVVRVNRTLTSLEDAVERLNQNVKDQSEKNRQFYEKIGDHETRLSLLESDSERKEQ